MFVSMPPVSTPGGELFDRIVARGHYSEQDASKLIRVIVEALQAIHSVGILHRWEGWLAVHIPDTHRPMSL